MLKGSKYLRNLGIWAIRPDCVTPQNTIVIAIDVRTTNSQLYCRSASSNDAVKLGTPKPQITQATGEKIQGQCISLFLCLLSSLVAFFLCVLLHFTIPSSSSNYSSIFFPLLMSILLHLFYPVLFPPLRSQFHFLCPFLLLRPDPHTCTHILAVLHYTPHTTCSLRYPWWPYTNKRALCVTFERYESCITGVAVSRLALARVRRLNCISLKRW